MRTWMTGGIVALRPAGLGSVLTAASVLTFCLPLLGAPALAAAPNGTAKHSQAKPAAKGEAEARKPAGTHIVRSSSKSSALKTSKVAYRPRAAVSYGISCVPYARAVTGIDVKGNAASWWANAAGQYERGSHPEVGSVMNFRATGRMRLGHVAVVTRVIDSRTVEIDHANWWGPGATKGGVSKGIPVIDVSENNDWSSVRVGLGHSGDYGSTYPTYGFIYGRPDRGQMATAQSVSRPEEVAEAPARPSNFEVINRAIR